MNLTKYDLNFLKLRNASRVTNTLVMNLKDYHFPDYGDYSFDITVSGKHMYVVFLKIAPKLV